MESPDDHMVQLLRPDGSVREDREYWPWLADINAAVKRGLYRDLVFLRRFDAEATALQRQGQLGVWTSSLGQEAAQIGSARALRTGDFVFPTYRDHGVTMVRGVDPVSILALFRGTTLGGWNPQRHRTAAYGLVLGSQVLHATGYAMGVQRDGADDAVVAYFGDGATSQGDVNEAFVWAAAFDAPVVFFCENNQWAISTPARRQTRVPLFHRAAGFGFAGVRVDGNDVLACLAVTRAALDRARSGGGPTLIEAHTYRMAAHSTSDDPTRYRDEDYEDEWRSRDPVARMKAHLAESEAADSEYLDAVSAQADELADRVRTGCLRLADPEPASMFDNVFVDTTEQVRGQRDVFAAYRATLDLETEPS
jgi:2-oxoisovalerate dehydrogenase E1 component alpha subunit